MVCTSGVVGDVMFSRNGLCGVFRCHLRERHAGARSPKFPTYSPGAPHCLTLSSYRVAANCSLEREAGVSDGDTRRAVIGWWLAACGIKAGEGRNLLFCLVLVCQKKIALLSGIPVLRT